MQNNQIKYLLSNRNGGVEMNHSNLSRFTSLNLGRYERLAVGRPEVPNPSGRPRATTVLFPNPSGRPRAKPTPRRVEEVVTEEQNCENGVCQLDLSRRPLAVGRPEGLTRGSSQPEALDRPEKTKVAISKISKQIDFDRENIELDQVSKVNTFTDFSPNPVLKSITPKPSESDCGSGKSLEGHINGGNDVNQPELEKILNDIDDE
ncbi:sua5 family protein, partial [Lasius niger]